MAYEGRLRAARTLLQVAILISKRPYTSKELQDKLEVKRKSIERCIYALEEIGVPIVVEEATIQRVGGILHTYSLDKNWVKKVLNVQVD